MFEVFIACGQPFFHCPNWGFLHFCLHSVPSIFILQLWKKFSVVILLCILRECKKKRIAPACYSDIWRQTCPFLLICTLTKWHFYKIDFSAGKPNEELQPTVFSEWLSMLLRFNFDNYWNCENTMWKIMISQNWLISYFANTDTKSHFQILISQEQMQLDQFCFLFWASIWLYFWVKLFPEISRYF